MTKYNEETVKRIKSLREQGKTYGEIRNITNLCIPKSTLSYMCRNVKLPFNYSERISKLNLNNLSKGRQIALEINKIKREELLKDIENKNLPIASKTNDLLVAKIALSMLCLGEASRTRGAFCLGSSDPRIVILFLELLKKCFPFNIEKVRCTVQCRADQNTASLEKFWLETTKLPRRLFYKTRIDPRTKGHPTLKREYRGVLKVDYFDTKVQIELEILANLIYNNFKFKRNGPEV